jgi:hypothetical protein
VTGRQTEKELEHAGDHVRTAESINQDWLPLPSSPTPHTSVYRFSQTTQVVWTIAQIVENKTYFQSKTDQTIWGMKEQGLDYQRIIVYVTSNIKVTQFLCTP